MSLKIWLPLNGNIENQGLADVTITNNGATVDNNGKIGKCYNFSNTYLSLQNLPIFKKISIAFWMKPSNTSQVGCLLNYRTAVDYDLAVFLIDGIIRFDAGGQTIFNYSYNTNWQHVTVTYDGGIKKLYINGVLQQSVTLNTAISCSATKGTIGLSSVNTISGSGNAYVGLLNDFRIYDHCLSPKEVKEISKGLVLHYPLNDTYVEGTSNLFSANPTFQTGWNNSGSATWNWDDSTIPKINNNIIYSISRTDTGNSAIGCGACNLISEKTYTASVYVYLSGNNDADVFYIRSVNTNIAVLRYNNDANPQHWPQNQWVRTTVTFTTSASYNDCYICTYLNNANSKRALTCWQIEEKDHATPYTPNTRNKSTVYDCSGFQNNGTITGALSCSSDSPRYKVSTNMSGQYIYCNTTNIQQACNAGAPFTISSWIKRTANYTNASGLFEAGADSGITNCLHLVFRNTGDFVFSFYSPDCNSTFNINNHVGEWNLITCTYDGSKMNVYINGELNAQRNGGVLDLQTITPYTLIGRGQTTNSPDLLSDFRIYATALSAEDIKELYSVGAAITQ